MANIRSTNMHKVSINKFLQSKEHGKDSTIMFCNIVTHNKKGFDTSSMLDDGKEENSPLK